MNRNIPKREFIKGVEKYLSGISKEDLLKELDGRIDEGVAIAAKSVAWAHQDLPERVDNELPVISSVESLEIKEGSFKWTLNRKWKNPGTEEMCEQVNTDQSEENLLSEAA